MRVATIKYAIAVLCILGCAGAVDPKAAAVLSWLRAAPAVVQCVIEAAPHMDAAAPHDASE